MMEKPEERSRGLNRRVYAGTLQCDCRAKCFELPPEKIFKHWVTGMPASNFVKSAGLWWDSSVQQ
jgi:hypothetical protein